MVSIFLSTVLKIADLSHDVKLLRISVPNNFEFLAGQYVSITIVDADGKKIRRPYSIASSPSKKGFIELCVKKVDGGLASNFIHNLKKGDIAEFLGPVGNFVINENSKNKDLIFVSTGTGIAPFASMIPSLLENGFKNKIILISGFRFEENILYNDEFSRLKKRYGNFEFYNVLSRPKNESFENKGHVQNFLVKYIPENFDGHFYICGLSQMVDGVKEKLNDLRIANEKIFFEKY